MPDEPPAYSQACSMTPDEATIASDMLQSDRRFSCIGITINSHRETYTPFQKEQVPDGAVLVTFRIPCEGVNTPGFYGELCKALNGEMTGATRREREG